MLKLAVTTKLSPEQVVKQAADYFTKKGLKIKEQSGSCIYFEGAGGGLDVSTCKDDKGKGTSVEVESREWDFQAREFTSKIKS